MKTFSHKPELRVHYIKSFQGDTIRGFSTCRDIDACRRRYTNPDSICGGLRIVTAKHSGYCPCLVIETKTWPCTDSTYVGEPKKTLRINVDKQGCLFK